MDNTSHLHVSNTILIHLSDSFFICVSVFKWLSLGWLNKYNQKITQICIKCFPSCFPDFT